MYLKESTALQIVFRNKLEKLRLEKYSNTATFFSEFEKSVNELKSADAKISEKKTMLHVKYVAKPVQLHWRFNRHIKRRGSNSIVCEK